MVGMTPNEQDYNVADDEPIKVPDNISMADLYVLLIEQNRHQRKFEKNAQPLIDVYNGWLTWKRGVMVWMGVLLAIGGLISTLQTIWGVISPHLTVK